MKELTEAAAMLDARALSDPPTAKLCEALRALAAYYESHKRWCRLIEENMERMEESFNRVYPLK